MAEGERVEFDEVVKPDTPATEATAEKPTTEEAESASPKIITSNDQTEITGAFSTAMSKQPSTKEAVVKPDENFYTGIAEKL